MLREGDALRTIAKEAPLKVPTLAIDRSGSDFTLQTLSAVHAATVHGGIIEGVGHYIAMGAPEKLAGVLLDFVADASLRD